MFPFSELWETTLGGKSSFNWPLTEKYVQSPPSNLYSDSITSLYSWNPDSVALNDMETLSYSSILITGDSQ